MAQCEVLQMIVYFLYLRQLLKLHQLLKGIKSWGAWSLKYSVGIATALLLITQAGYAQRLDPELKASFLADPLSDNPRDPLLPTPAVERDLSPLEILDLEAGLTRLDQEARILLRGDDVDEAFERWMREARLQRFFGVDAELEALERISQFAWDAQRSTEVRLLSARVRQLLPTIEEDEARLTQIAGISETLRDTTTTAAAYRQLAALAAEQGDGVTQRQRLEQLAAFHLEWFEFPEAATVYEQLLADATARNAVEQQIAYLEEVIYSYQSNESYAQAIQAQTDLLALYRSEGQVEREPALEVAIARNYRALNQPENAIDYYRLAYSTAQRLQQYGYSSTVLQDLGELYTSLNRYEDAVSMYNLLVNVEQQSYNHYGIMDAYDHLGQIYRSQGDKTNARVAFTAGLAFAEALDYRQDYFQEQIETVSE